MISCTTFELLAIGLIETYREQNAREPSIEEIYDNLNDKVIEKLRGIWKHLNFPNLNFF